MTERLPEPTTDPAVARDDLDRHGFCVLADALTHDVRAAIRDRVLEQAAGERARGIGRDEGPELHSELHTGRRGRANARVWSLLNKGAVFQNLLTHPVVRPLIGHLLGDPFLLSAIQANFASPGDEPLALHSDQGFVPRPWPPYPMTASVVWMIDGFTENNGATTMVPGTHLASPTSVAEDAMARARLIRRGGVPVCGPSGSALVFDGRIVHGTGVNTTDTPRLGVLTYCCRPFLRQQENFTLSLAPSVLAGMPDDVKALLGHKVWRTLGSVEGVGAEGAFVDRPSAPLGPLDPGGHPLSLVPVDQAALAGPPA